MKESECSGHPSMSITDEKVVRLRQLAHENRSHHHELAKVVEILFGSC